MPSDYPIQIVFEKGLSPKASIRAEGTGHVSVLDNLQPSPQGYRAFPALSTPVVSPPTTNWPFPQLIRMQSGLWLFDATAIYIVSESSWALSAVSTYRSEDPTLTRAITAGGKWHVTSWHDTWIATNGATLLYKFPHNPSGKVLCATSPTVASVNHFLGKAVLAGLSGSYFSGADWLALFALWQKYSERELIYEGQTFGTNWLMFSDFLGGATDYPFTLFSILAGLKDGNTIAKVIEMLRSGIELGAFTLLPLSTSKPVLATTRTLGHMYAFTAQEGFRIEGDEGKPVIGNLLDFGLASRGAIHSTMTHTLLVDNKGQLRRLGVQSEDLLGYENIFGGLTLANLSISYRGDEKAHYISDGLVTYVLQGDELSKLESVVTSIAPANAGPIGIASAAPTEFLVVTNVLDSKHRGRKHITWIELRADDVSDLRVALDYRFDYGADYITTPYVPGSPDGRFFLGVACVDYRVRIKGTLASGSKLERMLIRLQYGDDTTTRGPRGVGFGGLQAASSSPGTGE